MLMKENMDFFDAFQVWLIAYKSQVTDITYNKYLTTTKKYTISFI